MQATKKLRSFLVLSGLLVIAIGVSILFAPGTFHAANGIELAQDPNLMSEIRAPGGALLVFGVWILAGAFVPFLASASTTVATLLFLSYGGARLVSMLFDGMPGSGLIVATILELVLGAIGAVALMRASRSTSCVERARGCSVELAR